jgi:hypothetical protein
MHRKDHLVSLGDTDHLFPDDAPSDCLADVLYNFTAIYLDAAFARLVRKLVPFFSLPRLEIIIPQEQPVW